MKMSRLPIAVATAVVALLATTPAHAQASYIQPYAAVSGDNCRYGSTQGSLIWSYSSTVPIRPVTVGVRGTVSDRPLPNEPSLCRDDSFYSLAIFTAYSFNSEAIRREVRANNQTVSASFTLAEATVGLGRVVV